LKRQESDERGRGGTARLRSATENIERELHKVAEVLYKSSQAAGAAQAGAAGLEQAPVCGKQCEYPWRSLAGTPAVRNNPVWYDGASLQPKKLQGRTDRKKLGPRP